MSAPPNAQARLMPDTGPIAVHPPAAAGTGSADDRGSRDAEAAMSERHGGGASSVEALLAAVILEVAGREVTGRDLLAAGVVCERWQRLEHELSDGLGLVAAAAPEDADATGELRAFRLRLGLGSAEDLRSWMASRDLTLQAVKGAAERSVARARGGVPLPVTAAQVADALAAEAICSGALTELGWWLADRLLSAASMETGVEAIPLSHTRVKRLVFAETCTVAGAAANESGLERARRLARIAALDDAHCGWSASVTVVAEVERRLREHDLDWCRFELDELRFVSPGAAAEAARRFAEGATPAEVAAMAGVEVAERTLVLADAPSLLAGTLVGAVAGDVAGPWPEEGQHVVARVRARVTPHLEDSQSVARARDALLADVASQLRAGKVVWHERA